MANACFPQGNASAMLQFLSRVQHSDVGAGVSTASTRLCEGLGVGPFISFLGS